MVSQILQSVYSSPFNHYSLRGRRIQGRKRVSEGPETLLSTTTTNFASSLANRGGRLPDPSHRFPVGPPWVPRDHTPSQRLGSGSLSNNLRLYLNAGFPLVRNIRLTRFGETRRNMWSKRRKRFGREKGNWLSLSKAMSRDLQRPVYALVCACLSANNG